MAKIYETRTDFERDALKAQSQRVHRQASDENATGFTLIAAGWIAQLYHDLKPDARGWLLKAGLAAEVIGAVLAIKSWFTRHKAHSLDLDRERLGPETVALPPEMTGTEKDCAPCAVKKILTGKHARTPLDFAEPSASDPEIRR